MTCAAGRFGSPDDISISRFKNLSVARFVGFFVAFRFFAFFALIQQFKFFAPEYYKISYSAYRLILDRVKRRPIHVVFLR